MMDEKEIINLAVDCGALVKPHPRMDDVTLVTFTAAELAEFVGAVLNIKQEDKKP